MADRIGHIAKRALVACFAVLAAAGMAHAASNPIDAELRNKLRAFERTLIAEIDSAATARTLIEKAGLGAETAVSESAVLPFDTAPAILSSAAPQADVIDLRLALGLVSQIYGAKDNFDVLFAQKDPDYPALVVNSGRLSLADLFQLAAEKGLQPDGGGADGTLRVPVVIWGDASLQIGPQETLRLSRTDGAVLINFGRLVIDSATVETVGETNPAAPDFVPFVLNAGGASLLARNSRFVGLGFGNESKFAGLAVMRNPLMVRRDEVVIENNLLIDVAGLAVSMSDGAVIRNNRLHNTRSASLTVSHSQDARIVGNLIQGKSPTNGIRLVEDSTRGLIAGNVIMGGDRAGIVVRNGSQHVSVRNNIVWRRGGGGISLARVSCGIVENNIVMDNRQKGIEVRASRSIVVRGNKLIGNKSAGLWVSDQRNGEATLLQDNLLLGNGSGIASATGERLVLSGNDFTRQFPRFVDGDLAPQARIISANLSGREPMVLTAGGREDGPLPNVGCTD